MRSNHSESLLEINANRRLALGWRGRGRCRSFEQRRHCAYNLFNTHGFHAAKVDGTITQKTWGALDLVPQDNVTFAQWAGQTRLG
jgi:hypothetical protein